MEPYGCTISWFYRARSYYLVSSGTVRDKWNDDLQLDIKIVFKIII